MLIFKHMQNNIICNVSKYFIHVFITFVNVAHWYIIFQEIVIVNINFFCDFYLEIYFKLNLLDFQNIS